MGEMRGGGARWRPAMPRNCATVRARPGGNGECLPLCRTPRHEAEGGASTVPCALTMTTRTSLRSRRHAHRREIVPPCPGRIHHDSGAVTMPAGGLTMTAAERTELTIRPRCRVRRHENRRGARTVPCALTKPAAAATMAAAYSV